MPANRSEEGQAAGEATPAAAAAAGGFKAWLPLLLTFLLMPVLAYGMTTFILLPRLQQKLGLAGGSAESGAKAKKDTADTKKDSVILNKLLVNVAGTMGARYLLVSISVVGSHPQFKTTMEARDPQLRDMACGTLATKTIVDLEKPGARNLIRSELISGFNNILGEAMVEEIYLTEFAIQ